jgi:hypothetical protein
VNTAAVIDAIEARYYCLSVFSNCRGILVSGLSQLKPASAGFCREWLADAGFIATSQDTLWRDVHKGEDIPLTLPPDASHGRLLFCDGFDVPPRDDIWRSWSYAPSN